MIQFISDDFMPLTTERLEYFWKCLHQVFKRENDLLSKGHKDK
jgi:hypothetical protein